MNRRSFIQAMTAAAAVFGFRSDDTMPSIDDGRYGYVDMDIARQNDWLNGTVLLDGHDISKDCWAFDDRHGIAYCYKRNANGNIYAEWNRDGSRQEPAKEERYGRVQFFPKGRA